MDIKFTTIGKNYISDIKDHVKESIELIFTHVFYYS